MVVQTALTNIENNMTRLDQLQGQISSGSRINKPSDDPVGTAQALSFQEGIDQSKQYLTNIDSANAWLNATDTALASVTASLQRARELAVEGATDTASSDDRATINAEVQQLQQQVLSLAQTRNGASYLFAGTRTDTAGYVQAQPSSTSGAYTGNSESIQREVAAGVRVTVNVDATATFDPVFTAMNQLEAGLSSNNSSTIRSSIDALDTALNSVLTSRAKNGATMNRLNGLQQQLTAVQTNMTGLLSNVKDTDMASAITSFSMAQTVYQASLQAGARAMQQSLLDYLK